MSAPGDKAGELLKLAEAEKTDTARALQLIGAGVRPLRYTLIWAAFRGHADIVKALAKEESGLFETNRNLDCVGWARKGGHEDIALWLEERMAEAAESWRVEGGRRTVRVAVEGGYKRTSIFDFKTGEYLCVTESTAGGALGAAPAQPLSAAPAELLRKAAAVFARDGGNPALLPLLPGEHPRKPLLGMEP